MISNDTVDDVKGVLVDTLGIEDRAATIDASTPLFGSLPELDSLAVVELARRSKIISASSSTTASSPETRSKRWARWLNSSSASGPSRK